MSKKNFKILSVLMLLTITYVTTSCITDADTIYGKGPKFIRADAGKTQTVFPPSVDGTAVLATIWRDATDKSSLNQSVTVDFTVDDQIVGDYNAANGTDYVVLDPAYYSISPQSITFEPNELSKTVSITMNAAGVDTDLAFAIGLKMELPEGWRQGGHEFIALKLPNQYAGDYTSTGTRYNFNAAGDANTATWPPTGFTSKADWTFPGHTVATINSSTIAVHAANSLTFGNINLMVNPDNSVTITPNEDITLNALVQSTHRPSTYDPATKTFELYYEYTNTNGTFRMMYHKLVHE